MIWTLTFTRPNGIIKTVRVSGQHVGVCTYDAYVMNGVEKNGGRFVVSGVVEYWRFVVWWCCVVLCRWDGGSMYHGCIERTFWSEKHSFGNQCLVRRDRCVERDRDDWQCDSTSSINKLYVTHVYIFRVNNLTNLQDNSGDTLLNFNFPTSTSPNNIEFGCFVFL